MTIPQPKLDDRDFQALVTEARRRIGTKCPEWDEHNVSDPGITLIEQFAYMTEQLIYRVNRIPERMHIALLELLDIQLAAPIAPHALVRFLLTEPATEPLTLPAQTEVATAGIGDEDPVVFFVEDDFTIAPVSPVIYGVSRPDFEWVRPTDGVARPVGPDAKAFAKVPRRNDAFYLGFDRSIEKLVLRVRVEVDPTEGTGTRPERPPLVWEASCSDGRWAPVKELANTTDGLNTSGDVELQLPQHTAEHVVSPEKESRHWLRCRVGRGRRLPPYTRPPVIRSITACAIGATVNAVRAVSHPAEEIGDSDGTAAQVFRLGHTPVLKLRDETEHLEVQSPEGGEWVPWQRVDSFRDSKEDDPHFRFDPATGEIELGPRIRRRENWRQHGAVPPKGARLQISGYRQGAAAAGNVARDTLTVLRTSIPGVASVTNPRPAQDGVGAESLAAGRERAALELASSRRAVTADDYAFLAGEASSNVARAHCASPSDGKAVVVGILPRIAVREGQDERSAASRRLSRRELTADRELREQVRTYLDERRLLGTSLHVQPVGLRQLSVVVQAVHAPFARRGEVEEAVRDALYRFVNPLIGGPAGEGWGFGRPVNEGDLFAAVQRVDEVVEVRMLRMYPHDAKGRRLPRVWRLDLQPGELVYSGTHDVLCEAS